MDGLQASVGKDGSEYVRSDQRISGEDMIWSRNDPLQAILHPRIGKVQYHAPGSSTTAYAIRADSACTRIRVHDSRVSAYTRSYDYTKDQLRERGVGDDFETPALFVSTTTQPEEKDVTDEWIHCSLLHFGSVDFVDYFEQVRKTRCPLLVTVCWKYPNNIIPSNSVSFWIAMPVAPSE